MKYVDGARYQDKKGKVIEIFRTGSDTNGTRWTSYGIVTDGKRSGASRHSKTETLAKRYKEMMKWI